MESKRNDETKQVASAIVQTLMTPNESDRNMEPANVVDGLFEIARSINYLADKIDEASTRIARSMEPNS